VSDTDEAPVDDADPMIPHHIDEGDAND
jgi:hypothetical protein